MKPAIINDLNRVVPIPFNDIILPVVEHYGKRTDEVTSQQIADDIVAALVAVQDAKIKKVGEDNIPGNEMFYDFEIPVRLMDAMYRNPIVSWQIVFYDHNIDEEIKLVRVDEYQGMIRIADNIDNRAKQSIKVVK